MKRVALTTTDNPYNPFTQFMQWFLFDVENGYNTCEYLSRISVTSSQFTDEENENAIENAIDEIKRIDPLNNYIKKTIDDAPLNS